MSEETKAKAKVKSVVSNERPKFSPTAISYIEKLQKLSAPLDLGGQPTIEEIADALLKLSGSLKASQKDDWDGNMDSVEVNLNDPKAAPSHARPLLVALSNRLKGLYVLYESFDHARAQALTGLIEEVSQAIVVVAGVMDEKDEKKWSPVLEKAGIIEQKAADRLT